VGACPNPPCRWAIRLYRPAPLTQKPEAVAQDWAAEILEGRVDHRAQVQRIRNTAFPHQSGEQQPPNSRREPRSPPCGWVGRQARTIKPPALSWQKVSNHCLPGEAGHQPDSRPRFQAGFTQRGYQRWRLFAWCRARILGLLLAASALHPEGLRGIRANRASPTLKLGSRFAAARTGHKHDGLRSIRAPRTPVHRQAGRVRSYWVEDPQKRCLFQKSAKFQASRLVAAGRLTG